MSSTVQDTSGHDDLAAYNTAKYSVVEPDSNEQSTVTTGGEDNLVTRRGGADCDLQNYDSGQSGGRSLL